MDKFGIFKLLSSLFDFYNKNPSAFSTKKDDSIPPQPSAEVKASPQKEGILKDEFLPLQQNMLSTMKTHDDFVRRVKEKNKA